MKYSIRETLAAVGVIASLVFVGFEIRQNTIASRASAYQAIGIATASLFSDIAQNDDLWIPRTLRPEELTSADWMRITQVFTAFARLAETVLLQTEQGLLPDDAIERLGYSSWRTILEDPQIVCLWPAVRIDVSEELRSYVEPSPFAVPAKCDGYDMPDVLRVWAPRQ